MKLLPKCVSTHGTISCLALALAAMPALAVAAETSPAAERTWQLKLSGQPSGSFNESTVNATDGSVATKERMAIEINRLGSKVSITNETEGRRKGSLFASWP